MTNRREFVGGVAALGATSALTLAEACAGARGPVVTGPTKPAANERTASSVSVAPDLGDQYDAFLRAARVGDLPVVERAVSSQPALLFARDASDAAVFRLAAKHPDVVALFERRGFKPDVIDLAAIGDESRLHALLNSDPRATSWRSHTGETALHAAAATGATTTVAALVNTGADLDTVEWRNGETPMLVALRLAPTSSLDEVAYLLIGNGAKPNLAARDGTTPLHGASARRRPFILDLLLRKGARIDAVNAKGLTAADLSKERGHAELMARLTGEDHVKPDVRTSRYSGASADGARSDAVDIPQEWIDRFVAAAHSDVERVSLWRAQCPGLLNARASWDELAIEAAAHSGYLAGMRMLLDAGAPLALPTAAALGDTATVRRLLAADPDRVNERGAHDFPVTFFPAFGTGSIDTLELLLAAGARVGDLLGATVLHVAAEKNHADLVSLLLSRGASPTQVSRLAPFIGTPIDVARRAGAKDALAKLDGR